MDPAVAQSYRIARRIARRRARNFYYGFCLLPRERRDALCALYAFMRFADDVADDVGDVTTSLAEKQAGLARWREALDRSLDGTLAAANGAGHPIFPALRHAVERYAIPADYFRELIAGAEMDLTIRSYATFDDLYRYCYRVASVVGLCSLHVFGFNDPAAKPLAEQCGVAFQLTNILRDLREDAAAGRVYLPAEDLVRFGCPARDLAAATATESFLQLMRFEAGRARDYYHRSRPLIGLVEPESRPALWTMISIYRGILEAIERDPAAVLRRRVSLSAFAKATLAARGAAMRLRMRLGARAGREADWQSLA